MTTRLLVADRTVASREVRTVASREHALPLSGERTPANLQPGVLRLS
ncbi:hypothetical protein [Rathayibacter sp. Leaf299]|nr:hypothetical protein [Rathayibacter sp. Leaf299]